jgi:DNA-directed RNA polymerase subunit M/transcription elongation factor TFIIS
MTLTCPDCGAAGVELVDDNGAEYPETRVEFYDCAVCRGEFRKVLTA